MRYFGYFLILCCFALAQGSCQNSDNLSKEKNNAKEKVITDNSERLKEIDTLDSLLHSERGQELIGNFIKEAEKYQIQIIYTKIERDSLNQASFQSYSFGLDDKKYFYPASTVKLPLVLLSLEKTQNIPAIDLNTPFQIPALNSQTNLITSIAKALIVSDNKASNELFDFLGRAYIHQKLWKKGYKNIQIIHRLGIPLEKHKSPENKQNNNVSFLDKNMKKIIFQEQKAIDSTSYNLGDKPEKYQYSNRLPLEDLHQLMTTVFFPQATLERQGFNFSDEKRKLLWKILGTYPRESQNPSFLSYIEKNQYPPDNFRKYFILATGNKAPENLRIYNKVGLGFSYITETAYIVNFEEELEFLLSAVIFVPKDNYVTTLKFMQHLGLLVYEYEKGRFRKYPPKLSELQKISSQE